MPEPRGTIRSQGKQMEQGSLHDDQKARSSRRSTQWIPLRHWLVNLGHTVKSVLAPLVSQFSSQCSECFCEIVSLFSSSISYKCLRLLVSCEQGPVLPTQIHKFFVLIFLQLLF